MELPGSSFLLTLATISITFVAFSTVVVVFRQAQGANLMDYELVLLRMFLVSGLEATVFSLLPPLLGLFGLAPALIWRTSSLAFALVLIWRGLYFRRVQHPFDRRRRFDLLYAVYAAIILGLLMNAFGVPMQPGAGLYALAATWLLVNAIIVFVLTLQRFLNPPRTKQGG
jgi:hypothetical protein